MAQRLSSASRKRPGGRLDQRPAAAVRCPV